MDSAASQYKVLPLCKHPTDDPSLPCYHDDTYKHLLPRLREAKEAWEGSELWVVDGCVKDIDVARKHLPQAEVESDSYYERRVKMSLFPDFLKPVVQGFAGVLSELTEGADIPPEICALFSDVDLQGTGFEAFMRSCDELAWRDGAVGIFVEFTADGDEVRRPYLVPVNRVDLLQAKFEVVGGKAICLRAICCEHVEVAVGLYGSECQTRYRVYEPGVSRLYQIVEGEGNKIFAQLIDERYHTRVQGGKQIPLDSVPLLLYSLTSIGVAAVRAPCPLRPLFLIQDLWAQIGSGYLAMLDRCCIPVPVRTGVVQLNEGDAAAPIAIGPGYMMDLPMGGSFAFAEPSGAAAGATRQALVDAESRAALYGLQFLSGGKAATATEADLRSTPTRATLQSAATQKESAVQEILDIWSKYLDIEVSDDPEAEGGSMTVNRDMLRSAMDSTFITALSTLVEKQQLSLSTFLRALIDGRALPRDVEVADELEMIAEQEAASAGAAVEAVKRGAVAATAYPGEDAIIEGQMDGAEVD
jgi:hypothetical protein